MNEANGQLELCGLEVTCMIGDLPEERVCEQTLLLDVVLSMDLSAVCASDSLHDTVDYVTLADEIRAALVAGQFRMIESAAACAADIALRHAKVAAVSVRLEKPGVVPGLRAAAVKIERTKGTV